MPQIWELNLLPELRAVLLVFSALIKDAGGEPVHIALLTKAIVCSQENWPIRVKCCVGSQVSAQGVHKTSKVLLFKVALGDRGAGITQAGYCVRTCV